MKPDPTYENKYREILKSIVLEELGGYGCRIFLFGSRAMGDYRWGADFDIGIEGLDAKLFTRKKRRILDRVEESTIPWRVDIVNFDEADDEFTSTALGEYELWKTA